MGKVKMEETLGLFHVDFFSQMPIQEAFLTSKWRIDQLEEVAKERMKRIVASLTTRH